jgi:DNA-binding LytR/AlgR family response regulator
MEIRTLIVDDEPLARQIIRQYAKDLGALQIKGECGDALEAINFLAKNEVDLIFLDINMPRLSGLDFLRSLSHVPQVILTTAYTDYALESYELNILDYLKKPFSFERFLKAVAKAEEQLKLRVQAQNTQTGNEFIFVKSNKKVHRVKLSDILFIEGLGDYIKIITLHAVLVTNLTMKKIEELLPVPDFCRIHKSYIVRFDQISSIDGNLVEIGNRKIPVGNNYRQAFFDRINQNFAG